ncbi:MULTISPECIES: hypothetical protein [Metabacillus]|uniref:Uncharacterized protein n=1 Tax=Metabacillus hrfriensis TaxID=3048891 RepID=A0ACD4RGI0_9BACI|nr:MULTISPECIES: hypothetical protein [Metabacillus]UAL54064.1 hypothetical protein K8L98_09955 [Metabacillus dongyingensis]UOK59419.1 hypothetical protein MGI18_11575 [Bacillus sp. OVS6]USK30382.1 hypothetical protein LIT32_09855 [Bacillus sp. CMF21]WHZ59631.1 hypothetical protein QLQ22_09985 [Metabacillus sp. CT-WN-B3]
MKKPSSLEKFVQRLKDKGVKADLISPATKKVVTILQLDCKQMKQYTLEQ